LICYILVHQYEMGARDYFLKLILIY